MIQAQRLAEIGDRYGIRDRILFRAGAYKPRTRPTDFRGLGLEAIDILDEVREKTGLPYVTEIMDHTLAEVLAPRVDMFQIGTRNAQDFKLLEAVGKMGKPVVLKRGFGNDATEWFNAAEYIAIQGNLDPAVLFAPPEVMSAEAVKVLESFGRPERADGGVDGHIFNLGHGISQFTPPEHVAALVDAVHQASRRLRRSP